MRPIDQTILYDPANRVEKGNCTEAAVASILGLDLGEVYDVRVRLVDDETNAVSDWSLWPGVEIVRDDVTPPAVASIRTTKENCLTWEMDREVLHLRGFKIRHAPGVHGETEGGFGTAERVHEEIVTAPPFVLCRVPKGRRTFMIRAVDIEGNESEETTYVVTDRGPIDDQGEFLVRTEDGRVYRQRLPLDDEVAMISRPDLPTKTNKGMK